MKNINDIQSWDDYWKIFDDLCNSLANQDKIEVVEEFKDAQKYVNGLTDGWLDFLDKFKYVCKNRSRDLRSGDKEKADLLIDALTFSLKRI